jgi:hypothetical protein
MTPPHCCTNLPQTLFYKPILQAFNHQSNPRMDMSTSDKKMAGGRIGAASAGQFDSLVKLCKEHPGYGLLACSIAERFDPRAITDSEQATHLITMLCRRFAENESEALAAILHQLSKFRGMGALSELDTAALISNAYALGGVKS